ncbi:protein SICKLE [Aristolochia californica]|uniref:protein SICKLE n=1 Tax=Aristolochia californica TaxID=171875 RepID=UPI0035DDB057
MDESEKRKERLIAMRMEAGLSSSPVPCAPPGHLSNPLIDSSATPSTTETSNAGRRFDYYTDPMSAFSNNKRRNLNYGPVHARNNIPMGPVPSAPSEGTGSSFMNPAPRTELHLNHSPNQTQYRPPISTMGPYKNNPTRMVSGFHGPRGGSVTSSAWNQPIPGYGLRGPSPIPGYGLRGPSPIPGYGLRGPPIPGYGLRGPPIPGYDLGSRTNPSPNAGRSHNQYYPSPGTSSRRDRGKKHGNDLVTAKDRPELYYKRSMVEDPWRFLKPVVGSLLGTLTNSMTPDSEKSWLPKSLTAEKVEVSREPLKFQSELSLANCLNSSLEEAVRDAT